MNTYHLGTLVHMTWIKEERYCDLNCVNLCLRLQQLDFLTSETKTKLPK